MSEPTTLWIVTANFTEDGAVAWRRSDGTWARAFADAGVVDSEANAKELATTATQREQREITDAYVVPVRALEGAVELQSARERIRANGPTIRIRRPDQAG
jgi:sulfite reductase (NADPH) hemoprotein beta-component